MEMQQMLDHDCGSANSSQSLAKAPLAGACALCSGGTCGARPGLWGCFSECIGCNPNTCDWTCPHPDKMDTFVDRWREVGGFPARTTKPLRAPNVVDFPTYVPVIQHGYKFDQPLNLPAVALPTFKVLRKRRNGTYGGRSDGSAALRREFGAAPNARVLLVSVARDKHLEAYWRARRLDNVPQQIATMGVDAVTVPNFSFFEDSPRTHLLWNLRRMAKVAEELSDAGVGVIPHVNALIEADWDYWVDLLKAQEQIRFVAKEFQTGLARREAGRRAFDQLCRLQDRVGRALHPILIGGGRFASDLPRHFARFTIVDSVPFMRTLHRQVAMVSEAGNLRWLPQETPQGSSLNALWSLNIEQYRRWLNQRAQYLPASSKRTVSRPYHSGRWSRISKHPVEKQTALPYTFF